MAKGLSGTGGLLLRGAMCVTWLFAFMIAFFEAMYAIGLDLGSPEQNTFFVRMIVCLIVGIIAAVAHAYLIKHDGTKAEDDEAPRSWLL
jgi:hypothetical protein